MAAESRYLHLMLKAPQTRIDLGSLYWRLPVVSAGTAKYAMRTIRQLPFSRPARVSNFFRLCL
ncbi:hypothetical protein KCP73_21195 [Salmonella enterica subsp. enterica]|nr:hypothetical protein KCP73_21195 [Salmonella enterica subsp. enterica]